MEAINKIKVFIQKLFSPATSAISPGKQKIANIATVVIDIVAMLLIVCCLSFAIGYHKCDYSYDNQSEIMRNLSCFESDHIVKVQVCDLIMEYDLESNTVTANIEEPVYRISVLLNDLFDNVEYKAYLDSSGRDASDRKNKLLGLGRLVYCGYSAHRRVLRHITFKGSDSPDSWIPAIEGILERDEIDTISLKAYRKMKTLLNCDASKIHFKSLVLSDEEWQKIMKQ